MRASPAGTGPRRFEHGPLPRRPRRRRRRVPATAALQRARNPPNEGGSHLTCHRRARSGGDTVPLPPRRPARRSCRSRPGPAGRSERERSRSRRGQDWEESPGSPRATPPCDSSSRGPIGRPLSRTSANQRPQRAGLAAPQGRAPARPLVVVVKTRVGSACAGKDPDTLPHRREC